MDSEQKSIFTNTSVNFQMASNFEDACSPEDMRTLLDRKKSIPKVASWHNFLSAEALRTAKQSGTSEITPHNSPCIERKQLGQDNGSEQSRSKRWFNANLFTSFTEANVKSNAIVGQESDPNRMQKSGSYKNVSNFDINAIGPISF